MTTGILFDYRVYNKIKLFGKLEKRHPKRNVALNEPANSYSATLKIFYSATWSFSSSALRAVVYAILAVL